VAAVEAALARVLVLAWEALAWEAVAEWGQRALAEEAE
jgi:hypothetical protein